MKLHMKFLNLIDIKLLNSKDDILLIELNYIINIDNNIIDFNLKLEMKPNRNGDFTSDYNLILRNEIFNLKKIIKKIYLI